MHGASPFSTPAHSTTEVHTTVPNSTINRQKVPLLQGMAVLSRLMAWVGPVGGWWLGRLGPNIASDDIVAIRIVIMMELPRLLEVQEFFSARAPEVTGRQFRVRRRISALTAVVYLPRLRR